MATKIVVDPVTRIEGHLKLEVEVDNGVLCKAEILGMPSRLCNVYVVYAQLLMLQQEF